MTNLYRPALGAGLAAALLVTAAFSIQTAEAVAIRSDAGFTANTLLANDDSSTGLVNLGFTANFFGATSAQAFVNNNGNITFGGSLGTFTPFDLTSTGRQIIAPFFGDVDTRAAGDPVQFGVSTIGGQAAFGVNWINVDYFGSSVTHTNRNSFQLVLVDRSDINPGDFDIEFNFDQIEWETGTASGGDANGLGGSSARVGFSNGTGAAGTFFELAGSAVNGAFLDGGPNALISNELNSILAIDSNGQTIDGRYVFQARNGQVIVDPPVTGVPEPGTLALFGIGLVGLGYMRRRRKAA